jgi:3-oxoacyl-(acyl-carrier-protein) synthase
MREIRAVAAGAVDAQRIGGSAMAARRWADLGLDPVAGHLRWKSVFRTPFRGFRRHDRLSQVVCMAAEAAGLGGLPDRSTRERTALVSSSSAGCLDSDLCFSRGLLPGAQAEAALFPYTLPSTCLGAVAIRFQLGGPTVCLATAPDRFEDGVDTGIGLIEQGDAAAAVVCLGDWLPSEAARAVGLEPRTAIAVLLFQPTEAETDLPGVATLGAAADPAGLLLGRL